MPNLTVVIDGLESPATFALASLDPSAVRRAVERWMQFGVWVRQGDGRYRWFASRELRSVQTPDGPWPTSAFDPFVAQEQVVDPDAAASFVEAIPCPHCTKTMVPVVVGNGPNKGLPKCTNPECGRIIRPQTGEQA